MPHDGPGHRRRVSDLFALDVFCPAHPSKWSRWKIAIIEGLTEKGSSVIYSPSKMYFHHQNTEANHQGGSRHHSQGNPSKCVVNAARMARILSISFSCKEEGKVCEMACLAAQKVGLLCTGAPLGSAVWRESSEALVFASPFTFTFVVIA